MRPLVEARSVSKLYRLTPARTRTLKSSVIAAMNGRSVKREDAWALRDLDFTVERGACLGVLGHNGAGKSTLLRLLCGVGRPTRGTIRVDGRRAGVLTLGTAFHGDLAGRENLVIGAVLNGMTIAEARERQDAIVRFAELEDVIDHPLRTYSSGMYMRLAFATALHSDPDLLIIDEVLAVGDSRFQQKCLDRLHTYRRAGGTMVMASHTPEHVRALCDEVLVLENGRAIALDAPDNALTVYEERLAPRSRRAQSGTEVGSRFGNNEASVTAVRARSASGVLTTELVSGGPVTFELEYTSDRDLDELSATFGIFSGAVKCFEVGIESVRRLTGRAPGRSGTIVCQVPELPLSRGSYFICAGIYGANWEPVYDYHWLMHSCTVVEDVGAGRDCATGPLAVQAQWSRQA